jgi:hypothetical protein
MGVLKKTIPQPNLQHLIYYRYQPQAARGFTISLCASSTNFSVEVS